MSGHRREERKGGNHEIIIKIYLFLYPCLAILFQFLNLN